METTLNKRSHLMIPDHFRKIIVEAIVYLFVLLFVYAAGTKLVEFEKFREQLAQSPILADMASQLAWLIPVAEIMISILVLFPATRLLGLYGCFSMMVIFTAYIVSVITFSKQLPCACGGVIEALSWRGHLIFNMGFVVLALLGIYLLTMINQSKTVYNH
ncbi:MauE/DoxX family redox-associated membrane protein [Pedobacter sp. MC2016-24]|uniref:MauE/DoxX family redox-associated membrane protein n=1 Tax=Pedobacter sp. MC2016-24 TaxID=2780090 RepID=UPI00187F2ADE|nr:MauE/DoxX family redox-associated membrane protein [Pedobacter sp. MC2016-24]MBE9600168.1 hypothetical protein [Pedobacter sp. MC2016-24]